MSPEPNLLRIGASTLERQNRLSAGRLNRRKDGRPREISDAGPGDNRETLIKKPAPDIRALLGLLNACIMEDVHEWMKDNRAQLVEWLAERGQQAQNTAKRLARHAAYKCGNVPEQAEFLLGLFREAGLREPIEYVIRESRNGGINKLAKRCLEALTSERPRISSPAP